MLRMTIRKMLKKKKSVLFTVTAIVLLLSLFLLSASFFDRNRALQSLVSTSSFGDKMKYLEHDIISKSYQDLLAIIVEGVSRSSTVTVKFDQFYLTTNRDYSQIMKSYKTLVERKYSSSNNIQANLTAFNASFKMLPYNTTFNFQKENFTISTMPTATNYVTTLTVYAYLNGTFSCNDNPCTSEQSAANVPCNEPQSDGSGIDVTIIWEDATPYTCTSTATVSPTENNNRPDGTQFIVDILDDQLAEFKVGQVNGINGVIKLISGNVAVNLSQMDIEYSLLNEKVILEGGSLQIQSDLENMTKKNNIILYQE
jgi:hypothetical protein